MTRKQAAQVVAFLAAHYPTAKLDKVTVATWEARLMEYPAAPTVKAVLNVTGRRVRTYDGFPLLGELIEEVETVAADFPLDEVAWVLAERWLRERMAPGEVLPHSVREAVKLAGGSWAWKNATDPSGFRYAFRDALRGLRQERMQEVREELPKLAAEERQQIEAGGADTLALPAVQEVRR